MFEDPVGTISTLVMLTLFVFGVITILLNLLGALTRGLCGFLKSIGGLMFPWLEKRTRNRLRVEYEMLLWQNTTAISVNLEIFKEMADMPSFRAQQTLAKEVDRIRELWLESHGHVSYEDLQILLDINKELRRVFDRSATRYVYTFDQKYQPTGGWDAYFERESLMNPVKLTG